jgi:hypothetical protein
MYLLSVRLAWTHNLGQLLYEDRSSERLARTHNLGHCMEVPKGWRGRTTFYKVCQKASEDAQPFTKYGSSFRLVRTDSLGQSMEIKLGWRGRTTLDKGY